MPRKTQNAIMLKSLVKSHPAIISSDNKCAPKLAICGMTLVIGLYAWIVISLPTISPEIGQAYLMLTSVPTFGNVLHKFLVRTEAWYRPLTFYLIPFVTFHIIDIHDVTLIRILSVGTILLNGFVVVMLSRRVFGSGIIESALVLSLIVTHPIYFSIAYDGSGIVDPFVNIFINLFVLCYLSLLTNTNLCLSQPGLKLDSGETAAALLVAASCLFIFCAITSQERGLAVYAMAGGLYLLYQWRPILGSGHTSNKPATYIIGFCAITFVVYARYVILSKGVWGGKDYRLDFEPKYILENLPKCIELPLRLFFLKMDKVYDVHNELGFNLLALPFALTLIGYIIVTFRRHDNQEKKRLATLGILYLSSLPIPVYCGGNVWHFYTAAMYTSIATGRATWFWISRCKGRLKIAALAGVFLLLSVATVRGINQELVPRTGYFQSMMLVPEALKDPALQRVPFIPEVVYYDTGSYGGFTWPFGGQGNLFKYLYSNPKIIEIALVHGQVLESDRALCGKTIGKSFVAFGFKSQDMSWQPLPRIDYCNDANRGKL